MKIFLRDLSHELTDAWDNENIPDVTISCSDIFIRPSESIVSPANSFGFMDGGIDGIYTRRFGQDVVDRLQGTIRSMQFQELLVGQATAVRTDDSDFPYLISAPTMRVPMQISDPIDIYLATRVALRLAMNCGFNEVLFPGMGTGVGGVAPTVAAKMMGNAIKDIINPPTFPKSLSEASGRHYSSLTHKIRSMSSNNGV
jgi:O-acetyl-ADP-ribose deacetylase (regulator of RNase III)